MAILRAGLCGLGSLLVVTSLMLSMLKVAHGEGSNSVLLQLSIPTPEAMVRSIVPATDIPEGAKFNDIIDVGIVERWTEPIKIFQRPVARPILARSAR